MRLLDILKRVDPDKGVFIPEVREDFKEKTDRILQEVDKSTQDFEQARKYTDETQMSPLNTYIESLKPVRDEDRVKDLRQKAKISAVGQGLTTLLDAYYGSKGARIPVRRDQTTGKLMQALTAEDQQFEREQKDFESMKISQMIRDLNLERQDKLAGEKEVIRVSEREADILRKGEAAKKKTTDAIALEELRQKGRVGLQTQKTAEKPQKKETAAQKRHREENEIITSKTADGTPVKTEMDTATRLELLQLLANSAQGTERTELNDAINEYNVTGEITSKGKQIINRDWDKYLKVEDEIFKFIRVTGPEGADYLNGGSKRAKTSTGGAY